MAKPSTRNLKYKDCVRVEVLSRIKPEIKLLLSVTFPLIKHIGMDSVRTATNIPEEFEIDLIMRVPNR
ncbi:hypothetical protein DsansV1_C34g0225061 [Dioscorea sansibarensis]